eukprot:TRINITY_DN3114_c0_g1_i1.p1 TRINITY_DN3114_c0_g1~~TRINITY_DN3114_c0_g1_i1.p1  ORF type:complete len:492 (-),score=84.71 TRINITY_DN3114_c0_g1_i1:573-1889(-)
MAAFSLATAAAAPSQLHPAAATAVHAPAAVPTVPYTKQSSGAQGQVVAASSAIFAAAAVAGFGAAFTSPGRRSSRQCICKAIAVEQDIISVHRTEAVKGLQSVQAHFVDKLESLTADGASSKGEFAPDHWQRDDGKHGGGTRYGIVESAIFNRASVNYSSVHYDDIPDSPVKSATALSVIIHPRNPHAPSMHCHYSYTEPKGQPAYWRMIADLNPSLHHPDNKNEFEKALKDNCPDGLFTDGKLFGDRYFFIPELNMYRGTTHLFIAKLLDSEMDPEDSRNLAERLATTTIDTYASIVQRALDSHPSEEVTEREQALQLAYHTAYFYQVLFLDVGTTAGIMKHADNDVGTLASLPSFIDVSLLRRWLIERVQAPHDILLERILEVLPQTEGRCHVTNDIRGALAKILRDYHLEDKRRANFQADMDLAWWAARGAPASR